MNILECTGITKVFRTGLRGRVNALNEVDLSVREGEIFGLLGPNGAGKTTLVKILLGLVSATRGKATLFNTDVRDYHIRSRLGYLPENPNFPPYLSGKQVMELFGRLASIPPENLKQQISTLLSLLNIEESRDRKVSTYSKGMLQRLGMAQALLSDPDIVFLDEPTDGVDPLGRRDIRAALIRLKEAKKTIFLNSHLLSEVEMLCDRVAIMGEGRILASGSLEELTGKSDKYRISCSPMSEGVLTGLGIPVVNAVNNGHIDVTANSLEELNRIIDSLRAGGALIEAIEPCRNTLESYFIKLIEDVRDKGAHS